MMIIFNILMLLLAGWLLQRRLKVYDYVLNHLTLFSFIWLFIIIGVQLAYPGKVDDSSVILYYGCFFTYLFGSSILKMPKYEVAKQRYYNFNTLNVIVFLLLILGLIANYDLLNKVVFNFSSLEAWVSMRTKQEFEEVDESNIFKALFQRSYLIYIPLALFCVKNKKMSKIIFVGLIVAGIMISSLRFTRAPFLQLLIMLLISYVYIYRIMIPVRTIVISVLVTIGVFAASQLLLLGDNASLNDVTEEINLYLFGGLYVFQDITDGKYLDSNSYDIGYYTFDAFNYILKKIGLIDTYPSYVREWSDRLTTNTYSFLDAFALDFGIIGALLGSMIIGLFSDYCYRLVKQNYNNLFNIIFYGYICYFNVFVFANNEFIRFPVLLTVVILLIINFFTKKITYE
ncbi:O-antigen polymerase [Kaistella faecalis]|uniref:O-antigen polymerase n=1 Tax=Kaistella faecalis TaxID=2852098 RepID=UPI001C4963DF|nr:O-antigen polymerase [Chryseobacterium faecale]UFK97121.1 oligosaccharide repeat unit polymerase [Chryseobacterium faecale]